MILHRRIITLLHFRSFEDRQLIQCGGRYTNECAINGAYSGGNNHLRVGHRNTDNARRLLRAFVILPGAAINEVCDTNPMIISRVTSKK